MRMLVISSLHDRLDAISRGPAPHSTHLSHTLSALYDTRRNGERKLCVVQRLEAPVDIAAGGTVRLHSKNATNRL